MALPTVEGPITGGNGRPTLVSTSLDLATVGYEQQEYFVRGSDVKVFDEVLANPIYPSTDGYISPRTEPGFGIVLRQDKLEQYRIG